MLDPDIHTEDALALLTSHDVDDERPGPHGWTRRRFLGALGAGAIGGAAIGAIGTDLFGGGVPDAWAAAGPLGATEGTLVVVTLYGGFDGLNVVVPYGVGSYYDRRTNIAIKPGEVLPLSDQVGFHPSLPRLKARFDAKQVAVVQGVGYANPDLSHFSSMAIWMRGWLGAGGAATGWVGRYLDGLPADQADLAGVSLGTGVPFHMQGATRRGVAVPVGVAPFGASTTDADSRLFTGLRLAGAPAGRGAWHDQYTSVLTRQLDVGTQLGPVVSQALTASDGDVTKKMVTAARLLNADAGLRIIDVGAGGYDTHTNENSTQNGLPVLLRDLDTAIERFYQELQPGRHDRVTILVVSEFGRTVGENGTLGTDHGTTNPSFVIGTRVKGGLYGQLPSLTDLDSNGRMRATVDFRTVYGSILDPWFAGAGSTILGGSFSDLGLFVSGPGPLATPPPPVTPPTPPPTPPPAPGPGTGGDRSAPSGFVAATPQRIVDTRVGLNAPAGPVGAGGVLSIPVTDRFGVPGDATAVVVNVTAVSPSADTYLLAWSGTLPAPLASSANVDAGIDKASLVIPRLAADGSFAVYNDAGSTDVVVDLLGWFTPGSDLGVSTAKPRRLFDTRDAHSPLDGSTPLTVPVRGWAGVGSDATAVVVNLTATETSAPGFVTAWPGDAPRPATSNLNATPSTTVANMAVAALGADGSLTVAGSDGSTHVVVDVLATFSPRAKGRVVAVDPGRVVDTRTGLGAPAGWRGGALTVPLVGIGGVPVGGAAAVILNVVAVEPDRDGHVTVYPGGSSRPSSSNLNVGAGKVVSNLVVVELGYGAVTIESSAARVDLVADVVGYVIA